MRETRRFLETRNLVAPSDDLGGDTIYWHDGSIFGHKSFAGYREDGTKTVIVLTNSNGSVVDLGRHLLDEAFGLKSIETLLR